MKAQFWDMFASFKFKEQYYYLYQKRSARMNAFIWVLCTAISVSSITTWAIWQRVPWAWAAFVFIVEIIHAASPKFPFQKQLAALDYLLPQFSTLLMDVDDDWRKIDNYDVKKINSLITKYKKALNELEMQFVVNIYLPNIKRLEKEALSKSDTYFMQHYDLRKEDF